MSEPWRKSFVRVEWLAFQKAMDLLREAGFENTHFVSNSMLWSDSNTRDVKVAGQHTARTYSFLALQNRDTCSERGVQILVTFAKRTEKGDWQLISETVYDRHKKHDWRKYWVVSRTHHLNQQAA